MPILQLDGFTPTDDYHPSTKKYVDDSQVNFETSTQLDDRDTANRARANHTGTQAATTITGLDAVITANSSVTGSIDAHSDVDTTTSAPADGEVLAWNASNSAWEPEALSGVSVTSVNGESGAVTLDGSELDSTHTAVNYTAATADIDAHLAGIDTKFGADRAAADVSVAATPTNYTAATADVEAHLSGIDTAIGTASAVNLRGLDWGNPYDISSGFSHWYRNNLNSVSYTVPSGKVLLIQAFYSVSPNIKQLTIDGQAVYADGYSTEDGQGGLYNPIIVPAGGVVASNDATYQYATGILVNEITNITPIVETVDSTTFYTVPANKILVINNIYNGQNPIISHTNAGSDGVRIWHGNSNNEGGCAHRVIMIEAGRRIETDNTFDSAIMGYLIPDDFGF